MTTSTVVNNLASAKLSDTPATAAKTDEAGSADHFLKLLVAQMQNQDPLNPMDNAQVTSQMAQINTVNGIEKLNSSVQTLSTSMSGQFVQMQALQGASLVGRDVVVVGNQLSIKDGVGEGAFELTKAADSVTVDIHNSAGVKLDTLKLGAMPVGTQDFAWKKAGDFPDAGKLTFRVTATTGAVSTTPTMLMQTPVTAVSTSGNSLLLELGSGKTVPYSDIRAFN